MQSGFQRTPASLDREILKSSRLELYVYVEQSCIWCDKTFTLTITKQGAELKSYITPTGLVFTTISDEAPSFHEFFPDLEPLLAKVDFTKLPYRRSIKYEGNFNWKTM